MVTLPFGAERVNPIRIDNKWLPIILQTGRRTVISIRLW